MDPVVIPADEEARLEVVRRYEVLDGEELVGRAEGWTPAVVRELATVADPPRLTRMQDRMRVVAGPAEHG